jgi:non-heme chloroperoxidase
VRSEAALRLSYGDADDIVPTMSQHMAGLAGHARLSIYPGVGHAPFWEAPERFNRELGDFRASV